MIVKKEEIAKGEDVLGFYGLLRKIGIDLLMNDQFSEMLEELAHIGSVHAWNVNHELDIYFCESSQVY